MKEKKIKSSAFEKTVYGVGNVGANLCWTFMMMYVTMYYTDSVGIAAATAGTIMLIARFLDGISDVIGAIMIEKVHFKLGKIRPWFLISAPLLGISLWMSFHVPESMSIQGKNIYVFITYTFTAAVAYTIYNLAFSSILPLMSQDDKDRNTAATVGQFITNAGVMIMSMSAPVLLAMWGGLTSQKAWGNISTLFAVLCTVFIFCMGLFIKEKEVPEEAAPADDVSHEKRNMLTLLKIVLTYKQTWLLMIMFIAFYLASGMAGIKIYYYTNVIGNYGLYGTGSTIASLAMMITMIFVPLLMNKIGKMKTVVIGMVIYIISFLATFISPANAAVFIALTALSSVGLAPLSSVIYAYLAELVDYIYKRNNIRVEGLVSMASSVGTKVGSGLGGAVVGWGLALIGYVGTAEVQSAGVNFGIVGINALVPVVMAVIILICLRFWRLGNENE